MGTNRAVATIILLSALCGARSLAYTLVMKDGRHIEVERAPRYTDGRADAELTNGEVLEVRFDEVDEARTHEANLGGVRDIPFSKVELLKQVRPTYPRELRDSGVNGVSIIEAVVGVDGTVETVKVVRSVEPTFDASVADAVRRWEFAPYVDEDGRATRLRLTVTVQINIER